MKKRHLTPLLAGLVTGVALWVLGPQASAATNDLDLRFNLLTLKGKTYTNVTVTSREADYIFIVHAGGMENIKLADIPQEVRRTLGYRVEPPAKTNSLVGEFALNRLGLFSWGSGGQTNAHSSLKGLGGELPPWLARWEPAAVRNLRVKYLSQPNAIDHRFLAATAVLGLLAHLFFCTCCRLICIKSGTKAGPLVWLPILQLIPLLRAAGMSTRWFLLGLVPGVNLVVWIVWSVRIVKTRGQGRLLTVLLLLPLLNAFGFLYLAFSKAAAEPEPKSTSKAISLEAI